MDKWEYRVLQGLSEEQLNKLGEEGYEIVRIILPPPPSDGMIFTSHYIDSQTKVILKRRKE